MLDVKDGTLPVVGEAIEWLAEHCRMPSPGEAHLPYLRVLLGALARGGTACLNDATVARDASLWREHSPTWARSLNRRAEVEQLMFDASRGKRAMPTPEELRAWAMRLGVGDELRAATGASTPSSPGPC